MATASIQFNKVSYSNIASTEKVLVFFVGNKTFSIAVIYNDDIETFYKYNFSSANELIEIIESIHLLKNKFQKVKIAYGTILTTMVPNEFYKNNKVEVLQALYNINTDKNKCFADSCSTIKAELLYTIPKDILRVMINNFPISESFHLQSAIIEQTKDKYKNSIVVYCLEDLYCISIWYNSKLLLSKTLAEQSHNLLCYNLLAFVQMHNLQMDTIQLKLSGWITNDSALYKELYKYFENITFIDNKFLKIDEPNFEQYFFGFLEKCFLKS